MNPGFPFIDPLAATAGNIDPLFTTYMFAAVFGLVYSGVMTTILVCVREMIPVRMSARSMSFVVFFAWIGMGFGGYQGGFTFDLTGSYHWSYINAAIAGMINLIILTAFLVRIRSSANVPRVAES